MTAQQIQPASQQSFAGCPGLRNSTVQAILVHYFGPVTMLRMVGIWVVYFLALGQGCPSA